MSRMIASSPRRAAASIALVIGLVVVSACGGGESQFPSFDHPVKGDRVDPESFLKALRASFRSGSTAAVSFDVRGGVGLRGDGVVRYRANDVDTHLRIDDWQAQGASIELRTVGGSTYMRVPESRGLWVNLSEGGAEMPGAELADDADPRRAISDLRASITEVRFGGAETIGGVRAQRFQVVTNAKAEQGSGSARSTRPTVTQYWFDGDGRVVRRQTELAQTGSATFSWTKWGRPVEIVRPKSDTVVTLEQLEELRRRQREPSQ